MQMGHPVLSVTDLQQCVEPDALWRVDGGVEVVHDEVGVGEREVRRHQREQQPRSVPVLRVHVGLKRKEWVIRLKNDINYGLWVG